MSGYTLNDLLPANGFNLARAVVGSESTLVTILGAQMHLIPARKARTVVMPGFVEIYTGAECALDVLTFEQWAKSYTPKRFDGPPVAVFPDTFNNYAHPDVAIAAAEVLGDAGFCVQVSQADVCCGRPPYDYGFLGMAERWWREMLVKLRPRIRAGTPMVVLEPSCWASFKDELSVLLPDEMDAIRLTDLTFTLGDLLRKHVADYRLPKLNRKAIVHGHCHQKALDAPNDKEFGKPFAEKDILTRMGVDYDPPDAGCCGMAGACGYERDGGHYDVAVAVGERVLLPEVRRADDALVIVADGFSCQAQIPQDTDRHAVHLAQVLQMAERDGAAGPRRSSSGAASGCATRRTSARRGGWRRSARRLARRPSAWSPSSG